MSDFWKRTNSLIKQHNMTQRGLAIQCGFSERKIENQSTADRIPDAVEAVAIAQALNTTVEYLVTGDKNVAENYKEELKEQLIQRISYALNTEPDKLMVAESTTSYSADKKSPKN